MPKRPEPKFGYRPDEEIPEPVEKLIRAIAEDMVQMLEALGTRGSTTVEEIEDKMRDEYRKALRDG